MWDGANMLFRRKTQSIPNLDRGARFRRVREQQIVETAQVLSVGPDALGIWHVSFNLKISGPRIEAEEQRTLALDYFRSVYREPIAVG